MSSPNKEEDLHEILIDRLHAFQNRPPSDNTVHIWQRYFRQYEKVDLSFKQTLERLTNDPEPKSTDELNTIELKNQRYENSEFVKETMEVLK